MDATIEKNKLSVLECGESARVLSGYMSAWQTRQKDALLNLLKNEEKETNEEYLYKNELTLEEQLNAKIENINDWKAVFVVDHYNELLAFAGDFAESERDAFVKTSLDKKGRTVAFFADDAAKLLVVGEPFKDYYENENMIYAIVKSEILTGLVKGYKNDLKITVLDEKNIVISSTYENVAHGKEYYAQINRTYKEIGNGFYKTNDGKNDLITYRNTVNGLFPWSILVEKDLETAFFTKEHLYVALFLAVVFLVIAIYLNSNKNTSMTSQGNAREKADKLKNRVAAVINIDRNSLKRENKK